MERNSYVTSCDRVGVYTIQRDMPVHQAHPYFWGPWAQRGVKYSYQKGYYEFSFEYEIYRVHLLMRESAGIKTSSEDGRDDWQLGAFSFTEDPGSVPCTYMMVHNHLKHWFPRDKTSSSNFLRYQSCTLYIIHVGKAHRINKSKNIKISYDRWISCVFMTSLLKECQAQALRCPESVEPDAYGKMNLMLWSCLFVVSDKQKLHH